MLNELIYYMEGSVFFRTLQYATVGFGCICLAISFFLFCHFIRSKKKIGKAVGLMLLGESVGAAVTIAFAIMSDGLIDIVDPLVAMVMRWIMFSAAFVTSLHLAYRTWMIEVGADGGRE